MNFAINNRNVDPEHQHVKSLKAKARLHRSLIGIIIDKLNERTGTATFLFVNIFLFLVWIWVNSGMIAGVSPFDPYPFNFLTMTVSLEAIVLSIMVLISQERDAKISDVREEVTLQILLASESEITKCLKMLAEIQKKMEIANTEDKELQKMLRNLNTEKITRELEVEIETVD